VPVKKAIFVLAVLLALAAASQASPVPAARSSCGGTAAVGSPKLAYFAVVKRSAVAFRAPGGASFARFGRLNVNGVRTVFSVREATFDRSCRPVWFHVQLPLRPNGVTGWVRADSVAIGAVRTRIVVDLSDRRLTLFRDGKPVWRIQVGIGSPSTPTPRGNYYVNQRIIAADPSGPFGPAALGVSAFSPVLTGWAQGGPIAVHGTNDPRSIGHAASTGCIRVRNAVMRKLFAATPAGTPVLIRS
jgi:lipoprotein-anchoring transpeptidase ErfK/SrfK